MQQSPPMRNLSTYLLPLLLAACTVHGSAGSAPGPSGPGTPPPVAGPPPSSGPTTPPPPPATPGNDERREERRDQRADANFDANSQWDKLAEYWINGRVSKDIIKVGKHEQYTKLRFVVEHSDLVIQDFAVVFRNGEVFEPKTRMVFAQNSTSSVIDLPGNARYIDHIELRTGNLPGGGRAQIEVWGLGTRMH